MCGAFAFLVMDKKAPGCETLAVRRLPVLVHSKLPSLSTPDVENRGGGSLSMGKGSDPDQCSRTVDRISPRFETPALQCSRPLVHTKFPSLSTSGVENNRRTWTKNHHVRKRPHCKPRGHLSTPSSHRFPRAVWKTHMPWQPSISDSLHVALEGVASDCPLTLPLIRARDVMPARHPENLHGTPSVLVGSCDPSRRPPSGLWISIHGRAIREGRRRRGSTGVQ